jgi:hypothetical protein
VAAGRVGHGLVTLLALALLAMAPHLWHATAPRRA